MEIRRLDGSLAELISPGAPTEQDVDATEVALFAQDRWRLGSRLTFEYGMRMDREGIIERESRVLTTARQRQSSACAGVSRVAHWRERGEPVHAAAQNDHQQTLVGGLRLAEGTDREGESGGACRAGEEMASVQHDHLRCISGAP